MVVHVIVARYNNSKCNHVTLVMLVHVIVVRYNNSKCYSSYVTVVMLVHVTEVHVIIKYAIIIKSVTIII